MDMWRNRTRDQSKLRVLTNLRNLVGRKVENVDLRIDHFPTTRIGLGSSVRLFFKSQKYDAVVLYQPWRELIALSLLRTFAWPIRKPMLVAIDVVFTRPNQTLPGQIKRWVKSLIWRQVDLFLLHARDVSALKTYFGIPETKVRYIPFKVNSWEKIASLETHEGDYIFTGGKSRRDFRTFCQAMKLLPYKGIILTRYQEENVYHGTSFDESSVPDNIQLIHDDGSPGSWIRHIAESKFVVFCITPDSISASGVGAYLLAMALRKCVIITDCPATRDILQDGREAVIVPMQDPAALAKAIVRVSEDSDFRNRVAESGYLYAASLGGEAGLLQSIANASVDALIQRRARV
jgi:glycosyltransferase involved in cell wall biosynthesis